MFWLLLQTAHCSGRLWGRLRISACVLPHPHAQDRPALAPGLCGKHHTWTSCLRSSDNQALQLVGLMPVPLGWGNRTRGGRAQLGLAFFRKLCDFPSLLPFLTCRTLLHGIYDATDLRVRNFAQLTGWSKGSASEWYFPSG